MNKVKVLFVAVTLGLGLATAVSAKNIPTVATKMPAELKKEITRHIDYPSFAKLDLVEGEVWMKVMVDENSTIKIIDLSATNQQLGKHVKEELSNITIDNENLKTGDIYFMKVKFDIVE